MAWGDFLDNLGNVFKPKSIGISSAAALSLFGKLNGLNSGAQYIDKTVDFYSNNFKPVSITQFNGINGKLSLNDTYTLSIDGDFLEFEAKWNNPSGGYAVTTGLFGVSDGSTVNCIGFNNSSAFYVRGSSTTWMQFNNVGVNHDVFNLYKLIIEGTNLVLYINGVKKSSAPLASPISINSIGNCYGTGYVNASVKSIEINTSIKTLPVVKYIKEDTRFISLNLTETLVEKEFEMVSFSNKLKITYDGLNKIMIYKPVANRMYIGYEFTRSQIAPNSDNWRISMISIFDEFFILIQRILNGGACETAIKIVEDGVPADDFIGGQAHGDEVLTSFSCFIDNVRVDLSSSFSIEALSFEFIQKSNLFAPSGVSYAGSIIAKDIMKWGIYNNKYSTLSHNLTFIRSTRIIDMYLFMLPIMRKDVNKRITDTYSASNDYVEYDVSEEGHTNNQMFIGNNFGGNVKLWSKVSGIAVDVNIIQGWSATSEFNVSPSASYNKLYFDFTGSNYDINIGDNFKTKVEFDVLYNFA
jgi:hypothetical protein